MGNCLKTQLKSEVNNDNLTKLGYAVFDIKYVQNDTMSTRKVEYTTVNATSYYIEGDAYFTDSTGSQNLGKQLDINANTSGTFYYANASGKLLIDKYNTTRFAIPQQTKGLSIDIAELSYIGCNGQRITMYEYALVLKGDVSKFKVNKPFYHFTINYNSSLYGTFDSSIICDSIFITKSTNTAIDVSICKNWNANTILIGGTNAFGDIKDCMNQYLGILEVYDTRITGSIEEAFERMWTLTKRSGDLSIKVRNIITWHNSEITDLITYVGTFSDSGIDVKVNGSTVGTYNGSTWSYA